MRPKKKKKSRKIISISVFLSLGNSPEEERTLLSSAANNYSLYDVRIFLQEIPAILFKNRHRNAWRDNAMKSIEGKNTLVEFFRAELLKRKRADRFDLVSTYSKVIELCLPA